MASAAGGVARSSGSGRAGRRAGGVLAARDVTAEREEGARSATRRARGNESVRVGRACDREQRRPPGRPPRPHRARCSRRRTGATSSRRTTTWTRTASRRSSPATTGRRRGRRSGRTAATPACTAADADRRVRRARAGRGVPGPFRLRQPESPRSGNRSVRERLRPAVGGSASSRRVFQPGRVAGRLPGRSRTARPLTWHLTGNGPRRLRELDALSRVDHDRQGAQPADATRAASTSRSTARPQAARRGGR